VKAVAVSVRPARAEDELRILGDREASSVGVIAMRDERIESR